MKKVYALILFLLVVAGAAYAADVEQVFRVGPQFDLAWGNGVSFSDIGASTLWNFNRDDKIVTAGLNANIQNFVALELTGVIGVSKDYAVSDTRCIRAGIQGNAGICFAGPTFAVSLGADWRPVAGRGLILGAAARYRGFVNVDNFSVFSAVSLPVSVGWKF